MARNFEITFGRVDDDESDHTDVFSQEEVDHDIAKAIWLSGARTLFSHPDDWTLKNYRSVKDDDD